MHKETIDMKKFFKWLGIIISIPFVLFIILSILIYIPPVQNFVVKKAASLASETTGMDISVGKITLSFPINLNIHNVTAIEEGDTLLNAGQVTVKIQMKPLLRKQIEIDAFRLENISLNTMNMIEGLKLKGFMGELYLESHGVDLSPETAIINELRLKNTNLDICITDTTAVDTTASEPLYWKVMLKKADIDNVSVRMEMPLDSMNIGLKLKSALLTEGFVDLHKEEYSLGKLSISDSEALYIIGDKTPIEGFDPSFLSISGINIGIDSVYYCGNIVKAEIADLRMKERCGMEILSAGGKIDMNDEQMSLTGFELKTTDSYISLQTGVGLNISQIGNDGSISARLMADIGKNDIFRFVTGMPEDFKRDFPSVPLQLRAGIDGHLNSINVTTISAEIPDHIRFIADGYANDITDSINMCAHMNVEASFPDMEFAKSFLGATVIPADLKLNGTADLRNDSIKSFLKLQQGEGAMELKAEFIPKTESYFAGININGINVHNFMPADSLGKFICRSARRRFGLYVNGV